MRLCSDRSSVKIFFVACVVAGSLLLFAASAAAAGDGWSEEARAFERALAIRAKVVSEKSGIAFDPGWTPSVSVEYALGDGRAKAFAEYRADTRTIHFTIGFAYEVSARYRTYIGRLDPEILARDEQFAPKADHELGHALMDQVSRRFGAGPCFTIAFFHSLAYEERLGLNIVTEGVGMYFERLNYPCDEALTEYYFPETREDQRGRTWESVVFGGGQWLVNDILKLYGERGLVWLATHPFRATDNMRDAAVAYRTRALAELSGGSTGTSSRP